MATESWSTRVRHDSDATFREWGSEFATKLAAVGLVQTSDTGQINWATVNRAAANNNAGYEIWRFNDAVQGTSPIFLRIDYGTAASSANAPNIKITVGTGSNGSGTITGTALTASFRVNAGVAQTSDTARQSYMCAVDGFFGFHWKDGSGSDGTFFICRTCDSDGVADDVGAMVHWGSGSAGGFDGRQALRFIATAAAYTRTTSIDSGALGANWQAPNTTSVGSDIQVMMGWTITPRVQPLFAVCGVRSNELAPGGTFSATLVGTTPRTYLTLPSTAGPFGPISNASTGGLHMAMLWE